MRALETLYNGVLYRSRLEARWAALFDVIGLEFRYESKQFMTSEGMYLPDFYIPSVGMWIEIKPATEDGPTREEILKMRDVADTERRVGFILCGFPGPENEWLRYVLFVPGVRPVSSSATWKHEFSDFDFGLYASLAFGSANSRIGRQNLVSMEDATFKLLVQFGVIDRYRHNRAMQSNRAEEKRDEGQESHYTKFMEPLRSSILLFAAEINRYAEKVARMAA